MNTPTRRHLSFAAVLLTGFILVGASCKQESVTIEATPAPKVVTTTPEQAWDMYVQGWKHQNLDEILAACAPNKEAQQLCRGHFEASQKAGSVEKVANSLERGKLTPDEDSTGDIRHYYFSFEGKGGPASFQYSENLGWRLEAF